MDAASKLILHCFLYGIKFQGPVIQSIISLTNSLRGQLVKCFTTLQQTLLIFFVESFPHFFNKNIGIGPILTCEILTKP